MTDMYENYGTQPENKKKKKSGGFLKTLALLVCTGAVSLACGYGGGYLAMTQFGASSGGKLNITTSAQPSPSSSTTVASGKGNLTMSEAVAKAAPSVVEITVKGTTTTYGFFGGTYETASAGSGVILSEDGYIITNNHVVDGGDTFTITAYDGTVYEAQLVGKDERTDIGVLKVEADHLYPAVIGNSDQIQVGDTAIAIGNPLGTLGGTVTDGIISAVSRDLVINNEAMTLIQTNAQINSGNSGGGLFDGNGNLIGVVNAKDSGSTSSGTTIEGLGFAIPVNTAMDVAEQLILYGKVTNRPSLGIQLQQVAKDTDNYKAGLYILGIYEGTGAEEAGLQKYDRILAADGAEVSSYPDLAAVLNKKKVGEAVTLTIERDGEEMDVDVILTSSANLVTAQEEESIPEQIPEEEKQTNPFEDFGFPFSFPFFFGNGN